MPKKPRSKKADFTRALQCYVCRALDPDISRTSAFPICSRCANLSPVELVKLDPEQQKRWALANGMNLVFPKVGEILTTSFSKLLGRAGAKNRR